MNKIIARIEAESGFPGLTGLLAERLSPTDLKSLLLEVFCLQSHKRQPANLLTSYESDPFVRPSTVSSNCLRTWEQIAFSALPPEFKKIELSPVCPLGTSSVIAPINQNWVVATTRNTEVVSDSTTVMALECALRRKKLLSKEPKSAEYVHLAANHRLLRAQRYDNTESVQHFSAFALCSAGRDQGNLRFELSALSLHIRFYIIAIRLFLGSDIQLQVSITDFNSIPRYAQLEAQLLAPIRSEFDYVDCVVDDRRTCGKGYYRDLCFHLHATNSSGKSLELVDGGAVDWTQRLLNSNKERLIISGIGSERLCTAF